MSLIIYVFNVSLKMQKGLCEGSVEWERQRIKKRLHTVKTNTKDYVKQKR